MEVPSIISKAVGVLPEWHVLHRWSRSKSAGRPGLESRVDVFKLSFNRKLQNKILACQEAQAQSLAWY
jgi:hypothetical protein